MQDKVFIKSPLSTTVPNYVFYQPKLSSKLFQGSPVHYPLVGQVQNFNTLPANGGGPGMKKLAVWLRILVVSIRELEKLDSVWSV